MGIFLKKNLLIFSLALARSLGVLVLSLAFLEQAAELRNVLIAIEHPDGLNGLTKRLARPA